MFTTAARRNREFDNIEEENENLLKAIWHYNSNGPIDYEFTVGKDEF